MSGVIALFVGSVALGAFGHHVLGWLGARRIDPTVLLTGWVLSSVGLVGSALTLAVLMALPADEHPTTGALRLAGGCWTALSSGSVPGWREMFAATSILIAFVIVMRLTWAARRELSARRRRAPHLDQLRLLAASSPGDGPLWVRDDRPLAFSISGRPGFIVMSDTLRRRLTPAATIATLEHERAHLRGRHHALLGIIDLLASALPAVPLLRAAAPAVRDLVEVAADAEAARRCGPTAVQEALARLTGHPMPAYVLGMAGRLTQDRMHRLSSGRHDRRRLARLTGCGLVALAALVLPAATGWLFLNVLGCVVT